MFKPAFLLPLLALTGILTLSLPANAAPMMGSGGSSFSGQVRVAAPTNRSPNASSFGSGDTVMKSRSLFGGRKTETRIAADGTSRVTIQKRGIFGGMKIRVMERTAAGESNFHSTMKLTRKGDEKSRVAAGEGWSNASKTRFNIFTGNRTTRFESHNDDGSSRKGSVTMSGNKLEKGKRVETNAEGFSTKTTQNRTFFGRLKQNTITTNSEGQTLGTTSEKFRRNGVIIKGTATDADGKFVAKFDRRGNVKDESFTPSKK